MDKDRIAGAGKDLKGKIKEGFGKQPATPRQNPKACTTKLKVRLRIPTAV
jgi:hypothetical protein